MQSTTLGFQQPGADLPVADRFLRAPANGSGAGALTPPLPPATAPEVEPKRSGPLDHDDDAHLPAPTRTTHTLIVSDVHLGSEVSRAKELVEMLKEWRFERLILLGDIFDDLNFKRLRRSHWKFLSHLRKLTKPGRCEVIWIRGNHDGEFLDLLSCMLGIETLDEYRFAQGGKKFLCVHGDQFDVLLTNYPWLSTIFGSLYISIQRLSGRRQSLSRMIKRKSKHWLRVSEKVAQRALDYGARRGADAIFCGHTHQQMTYERDGRTYYNTGCWTDTPATFVTIGDAGDIAMHEVH